MSPVLISPTSQWQDTVATVGSASIVYLQEVDGLMGLTSVLADATHVMVLTGTELGVEPWRAGGVLALINGMLVPIVLLTNTVLFEYEPGDSVVLVSYTRASTATYVTEAGLVATAASEELRDAHYIGGVRHTLIEEERTNSCLRARNLSVADWVKTDCTAVRDQVGADGVANGATILTATAANATCLQTITLASSERCQSAYVKRASGAGILEMTQDNGTTWTAVPVTGSWVRVSIPAQTLTNPVVGFRVVTSGDAFIIDFVQNEDGAFPTSVLSTSTAPVTRVADSWTDWGVPFEVQNVTQYERRYVLDTGLTTDRIVTIELNGVLSILPNHAFTHVVVLAGTYSLEQMRAFAGVA